MNVYVLEIKFSFGNKEDALYPVILQNDQAMLLVDCGYAGFMPLIEEAASLHGFSLQQLTGIIITHHDIDHMGGLKEMKVKYPFLKIYASAIEEKYISGKEKSLRLLQAETIYLTLPEDEKLGALYFQEMLKKVQPVEVNDTLSENKIPPFMHGLQVIHTPGHMPGHISIYVKESKTLIAADALVYEAGKFEIANPAFTLDLPEAVASVKKLQQLEIDKIICYHGGVVTDHTQAKLIQAKLKKLLSKYAEKLSV